MKGGFSSIAVIVSSHIRYFCQILSPSNSALFVALKNALGRMQFQSHVEVETFKSFLTNLDATTDYKNWSGIMTVRIDLVITQSSYSLLCVNTFFHNFCTVLIFFWRGCKLLFWQTSYFENLLDAFRNKSRIFLSSRKVKGKIINYFHFHIASQQ